MDLSRRELFRLAIASPLLGARASARQRASDLLTLRLFKEAPGRVIPVGNEGTARDLNLVRTWNGPICRPRVVNQGRTTVAVRQVVLFDVAHTLPADTRFYGEGFQMLTQTGGTLGRPVDLGNYTDPKHYKLPEHEGAKTVYGLMTLTPARAPTIAIAFTSCRRFSGHFSVTPTAIEVIVDTEGLELSPGQEWPLEEITFAAGDDREALLEDVAARISANHPPLKFPVPPSGWCSWYCFGPKVTAQQVLDNLDAIAKHIPGLKYIQIDDGYQPAMGDWLETGSAFGGNVQAVLRAIRQRGFEPAIWVAPFIAEAESQVFRTHPDWFVKDAQGQPLRADRVTFGGWRRGPWYALDGTHPEAQKHLERVFRTMRTEWGCTYFKLDANFWGAIHGGHFHDRRATRVEAYRRGMQAVIRGAGDSFVLGCNHPIWASVGLIHGSRSSNDIKRTWARVSTTARQNLTRNWQNGRLWWNDPDAVVLTGDLTEEEFRFHATTIYASGGMVLSGDDLTQISASKLDMLKRLQPPTGIAARFADDSLRVGIIDLPDRRRVGCLLNWDDTPSTITFHLTGAYRVHELWKDEDRGRHPGGPITTTLPAHSGRILICTPDTSSGDDDSVAGRTLSRR